MKKLINKNHFKSLLALFILSIAVIGCQRDTDPGDDLPQEDLTAIVLRVTNLSTNVTKEFTYNVASEVNPVINLEDGKSYRVEAVFKNGDKDVTQQIKDAKDEHFLIFNFPKSTIKVTRNDGASSTRKDGNKVGLVTQWDVTKIMNASSPVLKLTLIHEPATVSEAQNGSAWGSVTGGETDAEATFGLAN